MTENSIEFSPFPCFINNFLFVCNIRLIIRNLSCGLNGGGGGGGGAIINPFHLLYDLLTPNITHLNRRSQLSDLRVEYTLGETH